MCGVTKETTTQTASQKGLCVKGEEKVPKQRNASISSVICLSANIIATFTKDFSKIRRDDDSR